MNRAFGWALLVAALVWGAWADVAFLATRDPALVSGAIWAARTYAWLVALGFSHLLLAWAPLPANVRRRIATLTGLGTGVGVLGLFMPATAALALRGIGALLNCVGGFIAMRHAPDPDRFPRQRITLMAVGFLIDLLPVVVQFPASAYVPAEGTLSLRLLLLARMAAVALPLLATLSKVDEDEPASHGPSAWLDVSAHVMTLVLMSAAHTPWLKYLLPLPAVGAAIGLWVTALRRGALARWATPFWLLVAVSVTAGLLGGLFAFNGPLPAPDGMDGYADLLRRLSRHAHITLIVTGIVGLALIRPESRNSIPPTASPLALLLVGGLLTAGLPFFPGMPPILLAVGPLLQVAGIVQEIRLLAWRNREGG